MNSSYYFFDSIKISIEVYNHCSNWKVKLQYALLNTKTFAIAFSQKSDLVHDFKSYTELTSNYNLPTSTATSVCFKNNNDISILIFDKAFQKNIYCASVSIMIDCNLNIDTIQKLCKLCAKKNIHLDYIGPQVQTFEDFLTKYEESYKNQFSTYAAKMGKSSGIIKKRKSDTIVMEVPADRSKRLKFLLDEASKLVEGCSSVHKTNNPAVHSNLQRVLNYSNHYKLFADNIVTADVNVPFITMTNKAVEDIISDIASLFIDSIIDFENIKIYVTSSDIFLHNHFTIDDCAYGENANDLYRVPTAVVRERSYLGSTTYYELSIYWGFLELLVTGGFYVDDQSPNLFLGSSLRFWKHGELISNEIYILNDSSKETYKSPRLPNQYNRRDSHRSWGFHSLKSFVNGYTPISPLHLLDHPSQKKKQLNTAHFASKILCFITSPQVTMKSDMVGLFLFFARSKMFLETCKQKQRIAINFVEFQQILREGSKTPVYLAFLVDVAATVEQIFKTHEVCYIFSVLDDVQSVSLKIVKDGLKKAIITETEKIIKYYI